MHTIALMLSLSVQQKLDSMHAEEPRVQEARLLEHCEHPCQDGFLVTELYNMLQPHHCGDNNDDSFYIKQQ